MNENDWGGRRDILRLVSWLTVETLAWLKGTRLSSPTPPPLGKPDISGTSVHCSHTSVVLCGGYNTLEVLSHLRRSWILHLATA